MFAAFAGLPPPLDDEKEEERHDGELTENEEYGNATDGTLFDGSSSEAGFDEEDVDAEYASLFDIDELFEKEE